MEKFAWDTLIVPGLREQLIKKYVPEEPRGTSIEGTDPLVYKITAFYWLFQELIGNWKAGRRLTLDQKAQLIELLVWNLSRVQHTLCEEDINISQETTEQIAQLVLACKEFHLKE
jgi:hypothetical protein